MYKSLLLRKLIDASKYGQNPYNIHIFSWSYGNLHHSLEIFSYPLAKIAFVVIFVKRLQRPKKSFRSPSMSMYINDQILNLSKYDFTSIYPFIAHSH